MSHWFHRNPIKATASIDFVKRTFPSSAEANNICTLLRTTRDNLLKLHNDPSINLENVQNEFQTYVSLILGFINDYSEKTNGDSKLRFAIKSRWTQSLATSNTYEEQDAIYELASIMINNALWLTKHAAYVAAILNEPSEKEAKEIHKSLKMAAGQFKFVQENLVTKLIRSDANKLLDFYDTTDVILNTYVNQSKAEAQEITIARAIELKHSPGLICSIANSTSMLFQSAADNLKTLDKGIIQKWHQYLTLKSRFYKAYTYCFFGQDLLSKDKCGDAVKCLQDSKKYYQETEELCKLYASTKGPGTQAIPERHQFYRNLGTLINRIAEKCERENGMIYHQKVALETPSLDAKAVHGLAEPEEFVYPNKHELWTPVNYDAFHIYKAVDAKDKDKNSNKSANITPAKEVPIPQGNAEPGTISGCSIS